MGPVCETHPHRDVAHRAVRHAALSGHAADGTVRHPGGQRLHRMLLRRLSQQR